MARDPLDDTCAGCGETAWTHHLVEVRGYMALHCDTPYQEIKLRVHPRGLNVSSRPRYEPIGGVTRPRSPTFKRRHLDALQAILSGYVEEPPVPVQPTLL